MLELTNDLTISLWFNARDWNSPFPSLLSKRDAWDKMDWQLFYHTGARQIELWYGNRGQCRLFAGLNVNPSLNVWHHLMVTRSGDLWSMYLDGNLQGSETCAVPVPTGDTLRIGILQQGLEEISLFNGLIDDIRIYNQALTGQDAAELALLCPEQDLAAYWRFDETTGNTAIDSSGNGHCASLLAGSTYTQGRLNNSLQLDGVKAYLDCGRDQDLELTGDLSIGLWFYAHNWDNAFPTLISKRDGFDSMDWQLFYNTGFGRLEMWYGNHGACRLFGNLNVNPSLNTWHHLMVTRSGDLWTLYLDGYPQGSHTCSAAMPTGDTLRMGVIQKGQEEISAFNGLLDDARLYHRALSDGEVAKLFAAP